MPPPAIYDGFKALFQSGRLGHGDGRYAGNKSESPRDLQ